MKDKNNKTNLYEYKRSNAQNADLYWTILAPVQLCPNFRYLLTTITVFSVLVSVARGNYTSCPSVKIDFGSR